MNQLVPIELKRADEILAQYGRWAQDRYKKQHCASIEHRYTAPDLEPRPVPFISDIKAMEVQRMLQQIPMQYRRVLFMEYIPQRLPVYVQKRRLRLSNLIWRQTHLQGLRMFENIWSMSAQHQKIAA